MKIAAERDTKAALLEAAETLIRTRGYTGFSYADLSDVVKIRKASIHHHFPTKESLGLATLSSFRTRYTRNLADISRDHSAALDKIEAYARLYLESSEQNLGCLCATLASEVEAVPDSFHKEVRAFFHEHLDWLAEIWRGGQERAEVRSDLLPEAAARVILSTLEGALLTERMLNREAGVKSTISSLLQLLCR